ncbi:MAG TPA: hypothetical protein VN642_19070 [Dongiaceae bacterium]|nr:hypothetical protein [Dongiaceae bacterium]
MFAMLCGCKGGAEPQKSTVHGEQKPVIQADKEDPGMVGVIKRKVFDENKSKSVGKAMDEYQYFTSREWKETAAQNGTIYVDFIGGLDQKVISAASRQEGVIARTVNVKFVVKMDGTCFVGVITKYDTKTDGKVYPLPVTDVAGVMNAIYANKELPQL